MKYLDEQIINVKFNVIYYISIVYSMGLLWLHRDCSIEENHRVKNLAV